MVKTIYKFSLPCLLILLCIGSCKGPQATERAVIDQQDEAHSPAKEKSPPRLEPFLHSYGEGRSSSLSTAKLQAFEQAREGLLNAVLHVADQVAKREGTALGLTDTDAFLLRFHDIVQQAMQERQVDMETVREAVQRMDDGDYRYLLELRLSKAFVMQEVQKSVREVDAALPVAEERFLSVFAQSLRGTKTKAVSTEATKKERRAALSK